MICKVSTGYSTYYSYVFEIFNEGLKEKVIIFDENFEKLICEDVYETRPVINRNVFIIDNDKSNWIVKEFISGKYIKKKTIVKGEQCFLDSINELDDINSEKILNKAKKQNDSIVINEKNDIKTKEDIDNLMIAAGWFHDAYIGSINYSVDKLIVRFDGLWGCSIELEFAGDIIIHHNNVTCVFSASIFFEDEYIYFVDDDIDSFENIIDDFTYFRGKTLKWKIILEEEKDELD